MIIGVSGYAKSGKDLTGEIILGLCQGIGPGWQIKKFADKLKEIAALMLGVPRARFEDQAFKESTLPPEWDYYMVKMKSQAGPLRNRKFSTAEEAMAYKEIFHKEYKWLHESDLEVIRKQMTVREFLIDLGTNAVRYNLHPDTWVNLLFNDYKLQRLYLTKEEVISRGYIPTEGAVDFMESVPPNWVITDVRFPNEATRIEKQGGFIIRINRDGIGPVSTHESETALDDWKFKYTLHNNSSKEELALKVRRILVLEQIIQDRQIAA